MFPSGGAITTVDPCIVRTDTSEDPKPERWERKEAYIASLQGKPSISLLGVEALAQR